MTDLNKITPISAAVLGVLSALQTGEAAPLFKATGQYGGSDEVNLKRIAASAPAAYLKYTGGTLVSSNREGGDHLHEATFLIVIVVSALASSKGAVEEAAELAKGVTDALSGEALSLAMEPMEFTSLELIGPVEDKELWGLTMKTRLEW